ncbi:MAG: DUF1289 domain-containing protein [Methylocystis sp.]|uniref:DUF1289 domain-containing protein n=1 Tax=Methylocystis sp. TaxID=1911079 RepID=UPI003962BF7E
MIDSPCVKICELDRNDMCVGCGRTRAEIAGWTAMSESQKAIVVEHAKKRRSKKDHEEGGRNRLRRAT